MNKFGRHTVQPLLALASDARRQCQAGLFGIVILTHEFEEVRDVICKYFVMDGKRTIPSAV